MSNFVQPHRWQPTRLLRPWDSPGKDTGVGCHFLLQCMKVKSESEVTQSCPTFCEPMDYSLPGSCVHEIFQARVYWSGVPVPSLRTEWWWPRTEWWWPKPIDRGARWTAATFSNPSGTEQSEEVPRLTSLLFTSHWFSPMSSHNQGTEGQGVRRHGPSRSFFQGDVALWSLQKTAYQLTSPLPPKSPWR